MTPEQVAALRAELEKMKTDEGASYDSWQDGYGAAAVDVLEWLDEAIGEVATG